VDTGSGGGKGVVEVGFGDVTDNIVVRAVGLHLAQ
jgi:hypothetical protein